ncbi:MarR family transcriptional regulator [Brevibacterium sp. LE-L]|uniref:MarR family transcriptional regulator n=1 Tax=unclassified Brevibacterium TaxID=2614124 RepID=UPI003CEEE712
MLRIELRIVNDRVAMAAGLNPRDLDILDIIDRDGPCTPSYLSDRTGYHRATLTGILSRLVKDGWLIRDSHPEDGRSARLTPSTRFAELRELYAPVDEASTDLMKRLSSHDRKRLAEVLHEVAAVTRQASSDITPPLL